MQEDELVTTGVSGGISPYMAIVFPREEAHSFRGYYAFQGMDPAHPRWEAAFLWIIRKVSAMYGSTIDDVGILRR